MKIVIVCSSLEVGKDGVGDYVRSLSSELVKLNQSISIFAFSDKYISAVVEEDSGGVQIKRIPSSLSLKSKFLLFQERANAINPDWICLQYGPFAYNKKGLPFKLGYYFKKAAPHIKWNIMFHELWVAMEKETNIKSKLLGFGQRMVIKSLLNNIRPVLVHTQTELYVKQLEKLGTKAKLLPLFSNIPVIKKSSSSLSYRRNDLAKGDEVILVLFGVIHATTPAETFAGEVAKFSRKSGIIFKLYLLGKSSDAEKKRWSSAFENNGMEVKHWGIQPAEKVSEILSTAAAGIATTAYDVIEKSGTLAALKAHGLPVICVSNNWTPAGIAGLNDPQGVVRYQKGNFESIMLSKFKTPVSYSPYDVALQLCNDLAN